MRIKNKKTGKLIEVPPHLESDVKAIIAKGGDPMVILNINVPEAQTGKRIPFTDEYGNQVPQDWGNNTDYMKSFTTYLNNQGFDGTDPVIQQRPQQQFEPIQPMSVQQGLPNGQLSTKNIEQPFYQNADAPQEQGQNPMPILKTLVQAGSQIEPLARNAWTSLGNTMKNRRTQAYEANQLNKALRQSYNTNFSEDMFGTNQGLQLFEMGGINNYKAEYGANIEVEGNELIQTPDGLAQTVYGNSHSDGGINMNLPPDSKVFSEKLKIPIKGKKKSFAKIAKPFETKKDIEHLESSTSDNINKKTAELNIALKNNVLDGIFELQENSKISGLFGSKVRKEAIKNYEMKYGGEIPMAKNGKDLSWLKPFVSKTKTGRTTPTNIDLQGLPPQPVNWNNVANKWIDINPDINSPVELQEEMYDYWLDKYQFGTPQEKQEALKQFKGMWGTFGDVKFNPKNPPKGISKNWKNWKVDDKTTYDDLARLRGNFMDAKPEARYMLPQQKSVTSPKTNQIVASDTPLNPVSKAKATTPTKSAFNIPQAIPMPMGNIYGEEAVARFEIPDRNVPFRRMSPQQGINEINRNSRAALTLLGNTPTDVSNIANILTQADVQSANVIDQVNRQNIQNQMGIDQFNAQFDRQRDLSQLQEDVRFTDAIARRKAAIQGSADLNKGQYNQNLMNMFMEQRDKDFANSIYDKSAFENWQFSNMSSIPKTEEKKKKAMYGAKIKVKKKSKLTK